MAARERTRSMSEGRRAAGSVHRTWLRWLGALVLALTILRGGSGLGAAAEKEASEHGDLAEVGAKLANPVSDVWALFTEFDLTFSSGRAVNSGTEVGGRMIFQPVLPFPVYGKGERAWKLITRPTIPIIFSQPVPKGGDEATHLGGTGDIQLPMLISPPTGNWLLGAGPAWLFPTANHQALGRQQYGVGPSGVVGYKTKDWIAGVFPQYYFGIGSSDDRTSGTADASYLNLLYFFVYNLPDAWQVGFNPTITYDAKASSGNQWNVPIGLFVAKTTKLFGLPVKFQLGAEYSAVHQHDFGQQFQFKLNVIPVIPSLVKSPLFGGE